MVKRYFNAYKSCGIPSVFACITEIFIEFSIWRFKGIWYYSPLYTFFKEFTSAFFPISLIKKIQDSLNSLDRWVVLILVGFLSVPETISSSAIFCCLGWSCMDTRESVGVSGFCSIMVVFWLKNLDSELINENLDVFLGLYIQWEVQMKDKTFLPITPGQYLKLLYFDQRIMFTALCNLILLILK